MVGPLFQVVGPLIHVVGPLIQVTFPLIQVNFSNSSHNFPNSSHNFPNAKLISLVISSKLLMRQYYLINTSSWPVSFTANLFRYPPNYQVFLTCSMSLITIFFRPASPPPTHGLPYSLVKPSRSSSCHLGGLLEAKPSFACGSCTGGRLLLSIPRRLPDHPFWKLPSLFEPLSTPVLHPASRKPGRRLTLASFRIPLAWGL